MKTISETIKEGKTLVSDGAWGTFLHHKGLTSDESPEAWNLDHEEDVLEIAKSYVNAGADMILTNSFGASPSKLKGYGLEDKTFEINKKAAEISKKAAGNDVFVLGSIGPTGKMLMMGEISEEELYNGFKDQARGLEAGGADAILVETMTDLQEAVIAVKAAKENTSLEIIATMTFEQTAEGKYHTMMGIAPEEATNELVNAGADIIGANCGNGIKGMIPIVKEIRDVNPEIPVLIHANAGMPVYENGKTVFPETPDEMCKSIPELVESGANIIGGCCGTTPDHIRKMVETLKK